MPDVFVEKLNHLHRFFFFSFDNSIFSLIPAITIMERIAVVPVLAETGCRQAHQSLHIQRN